MNGLEQRLHDAEIEAETLSKIISLFSGEIPEQIVHLKENADWQVEMLKALLDLEK